MPQITPQEQEEFEFRARMEQEQAGQPPTNASEELRAKHAKNVAAEQAIYKPSLGDVWTQGYNKGGAGMALTHTMGEMGQDIGQVLKETPQRLGGMVSGLAGMTTPEPGAPMVMGVNLKKLGEAGPQMIRSATEPLISPRTTGKAIMEAGVDTAVMGGVAKGMGAAGEFVSQAPQRSLRKGTQQMIAGLKPNVRTAEALKAAESDFIDYMGRTGKKITDSKSAVDVYGGAADEFYQTNYQPLAKEIESVSIQHNGQATTPSQLLERRAEINDTLGRIGYYDKNPLVQSYARSSPQVQALLEEAESVRSTLNQAVDTLTPTNVGAAKILRKYADMKQVSDMSKIRAKRIELAKDIKAGEADPLGTKVADLAKDAAVTLGTLGLNPKLINRWVQAVRSYSKKAPDPDVLFKRGGQSWERGSKAAQPMQVERQPRRLGPSTEPDPSGVSPMSQQGVGAQFEGLSQGMGQGRPGQLQLPAIGETPGSTYNALAGTGPQGGGNLGQRLLPAAPDIQVPGGFSQLSEIQPEIEKMIQQSRGNALAAQGYNPNQLFQPGGRILDPAQQLQMQRMEPGFNAFPNEPVLPTVGGRQLQPYSTLERRRPGTAGVEQRAGYSSAQQAAANPEVAQRAVELHDAINDLTSAGKPAFAEMDELTQLVKQNEWLDDYIAYGRSPVQRGGIRR